MQSLSEKKPKPKAKRGLLRRGLRIVDIITILYMSFCVLELNSSNYKYICLGLLVCWFVLATLTFPEAIRGMLNNTTITFLFLFSLFYFLYVGFLLDITSALKHSLTVVIAESPFFIYIFYKKNEEKYKIPLLVPFAVLAVIMFLCGNLLQLVLEDPMAARALAAEHSDYEDYITGGGYQTVYAVALMVPVLIKTLNEKKYKIVKILMIGLSVYTLFVCGYTIAILIFVIELFFLLYWNKNDTQTKKTVKLLALIVSIVLLFLLKRMIGELFVNVISPLFKGSFTERRMKELGELLMGEATKNNGALGRFELYQISFKTFINHPFIGVSYKTLFSAALEENFNGVRYLGLHSSILDGFARMGIFYVLYVIFYFRSIIDIKKYTGNIYWVIGITFFVLKTINIANVFGLSFVCFFAIPLLLEQSFKSTQETQEAVAKV